LKRLMRESASQVLISSMTRCNRTRWPHQPSPGEAGGASACTLQVVPMVWPDRRRHRPAGRMDGACRSTGIRTRWDIVIFQ
jgi:hypothetical protein